MGVAEQGGGDAEALAHPEREGPHPLAGHVTEPDDVKHVADAVAGDAVAVGQPPEMVGGAAAADDGLGIEQCPDRADRVGQLAIGLAVDEDGAELGASRPRTMRMVVDLPAPLGPRKPVTRPGWTTKETSSTATVLP